MIDANSCDFGETLIACLVDFRWENEEMEKQYSMALRSNNERHAHLWCARVHDAHASGAKLKDPHVRVHDAYAWKCLALVSKESATFSKPAFSCKIQNWRQSFAIDAHACLTRTRRWVTCDKTRAREAGAETWIEILLPTRTRTWRVHMGQCSLSKRSTQ